MTTHPGAKPAAGSPEIALDYETLRASGLLWKINHDLLHPLGMALAAVDCEGFDHPAEGGVVLSVLVAPDGRWEFPPALDADQAARFAGWYADTVDPLITSGWRPRWCSQCSQRQVTFAGDCCAVCEDNG